MTFKQDYKPLKTFTVPPRNGHPHTHTVIFLHGRGSDGPTFAWEIFESECSPHVQPFIPPSSPSIPIPCVLPFFFSFSSFFFSFFSFPFNKIPPFSSFFLLQHSTPPVDSDPASQPPRTTLPLLFPTIKWVFPTSPLVANRDITSRLTSRTSTVPTSTSAVKDFVFPQWFDVYNLSTPDVRSGYQIEDIQAVLPLLQHIVDAEDESFKSRGRTGVVVMGISQGCAVVSHLVMSRSEKILGMVGIAGWMGACGKVEGVLDSVDRESTEEDEGEGREDRDEKRRRKKVGAVRDLMTDDDAEIADQSTVLRKDFPVLLVHCEDDYTVDIKQGQRAAKAFERMGAKVVWKGYVDGGHWLNEPKGMDDLYTFLAKIMS